MFGLCNQTVIRWFTVQNQSDSCSFVAVVTTARVVLSNSFSDRVILQWVSELWPKTLKEEFVHLSVCFGTVYQWLWVFQTCICIMALVTCCITWQSSLLFLYTLFINESRFLGLRAEWVKPCHTPCAERTSRFLPKNTVSHFLLGRIPLSNLVNFCPVISSTKGDIIVAQLLSSNFAMKEYPQNFNLVTLKSKYMISIQGLRRHLINCYYYCHLIFSDTDFWASTMISFFHWNLRRTIEKAFWEADFWPRFPFWNESPDFTLGILYSWFGFFFWSAGDRVGWGKHPGPPQAFQVVFAKLLAFLETFDLAETEYF